MTIFEQDISAVIPAFNEAFSIEKAVLDTKRVLGNQASITVVDDGSHDETALYATRAGARVIPHGINQGKGAAMKTGALAATSSWVIILDADLSTHPEELYSFIEHLDSSDILIGSRRAPGSIIEHAQPWYRIYAGVVFNLLARGLSGLPYQDTQCGFKMYRLSVCRPIFEALTTHGWSTDVELLMRAQAQGLRIRELPVHWRHVGGSRVRFSHAPRILKELWRLRRLISSLS